MNTFVVRIKEKYWNLIIIVTYGSANIYFRLREMKQRNSIIFIYKYVHCERHDFYKFREWFTCTSVWLLVLLARSGSESRATKMYWHKLIMKNEIASIRYESTECVYLELINGSFLKGLMLDFFFMNVCISSDFAVIEILKRRTKKMTANCSHFQAKSIQ